MTLNLLKHAKNNNVIRSHLVLFSRPYRISVNIGKYEKIVIVASGFGIAVYLLYLKRLIYTYNSYKICIRQIHLVWQIKDIGKFKLVI